MKISQEQLWYMAQVYPEAISQRAAEEAYQLAIHRSEVDSSYWKSVANAVSKLMADSVQEPSDPLLVLLKRKLIGSKGIFMWIARDDDVYKEISLYASEPVFDESTQKYKSEDRSRELCLTEHYGLHPGECQKVTLIID